MMIDIVKNIPKYLSTIASDIYIIKDNIYKINYDGIKIKYKVVNENPYNNIEKTCIINNKKVFVFNEEDYKIIIVVEISEKEISEDKKTLLIADDSELIVKFCKKVLGSKYNILSASNGNEAIEMLENEKVDALLLDLMMPISSGYQVLEKMKEKDLFVKVPTAIISGEDSKDGIDKAMQYNVVDMIEKPFSVDKIETLVNKLIERGSL